MIGSVLYCYAACTVALFLKMFCLSAYQGYHRIGKRVFAIPEDARAFGRGAAAAQELPQVQRAQLAWRNDVENIPIFLSLGIVYVMVDAAPTAGPYLFVGFTIARIVHTLAYLAGLQPWRTIAYAAGIVCMFAMSWNIVQAIV
jgi:glutathione S-transferase